MSLFEIVENSWNSKFLPRDIKSIHGQSISFLASDANFFGGHYGLLILTLIYYIVLHARHD